MSKDKYKFTLNEEAEKFAEEYLGETSEKRERCLNEIKDYLKENPNINAKCDDLSILSFLRGCKFNINKTKAKLCNYYEMRSKIPEWFSNRDPRLKEIDDLVKLGCFVPIPQKDPGPLVVIIRTAVHNPRKHKQNDVFKAGKMILDLAVREYEAATIYGVIAIFDMQNVSLAHARQLPPSLIRKAVFAWQNYHCRPQFLEFVNAPIYINVTLKIFKSFMTKKLRERVHVHFTGFNNLHKIAPKDILPLEYGGENGKIAEFIEYWRNKLNENIEWFQDDEQFKSVIM